MSSKKERNHYDLKEMGNMENAKIVSIAWHHVLTEMFTITEKSALLHVKVKFLTSPKPSRHHGLLLIFCKRIVLGTTLEAVVVFFFFFLNVQFFRYWKSKKIYSYCIHTLIQELCSVVFKHFRVLLAACVIISICKTSFTLI